MTESQWLGVAILAAVFLVAMLVVGGPDFVAVLFSTLLGIVIGGLLFLGVMLLIGEWRLP
jgi:hypothetical protein